MHFKVIVIFIAGLIYQHKAKKERYRNHLLFHASWILMWLPWLQRQQWMFHHSVSTYSLGWLLSASSLLSTSTHAWTHSHVQSQTLLSSTWSSWAVLSQSREPDYPLALNFILFHSHLGGDECSTGDTKISHLLIKAHFGHISRTDGLFWQHNRHYLGYFLQQTEITQLLSIK